MVTLVTFTSRFTSGRERCLWAGTLGVVVAIYSTLGLAGTLAGAVRQDLLEAGVVLCMLLVLATIVTQGLRARPGGAEIGIALGIAAAYTLVFLRMNGSVTERTHLMEYGVVGVFIHEALTERASQGRRVPVPALLAMLATTLVGALDEGIQAILPSRVFDPMDMLFNVFPRRAPARHDAGPEAGAQELYARPRDHQAGRRDCAPGSGHERDHGPGLAGDRYRTRVRGQPGARAGGGGVSQTRRAAAVDERQYLATVAGLVEQAWPAGVPREVRYPLGEIPGGAAAAAYQVST